MDLATLVGILRPLIDLSQPEWKKNQEGLRQRFADETSRATAEQHVYVSRWCHEVHGLPVAAIDRDATVEMSLRSIPRRVGIAGRNLSEMDVLLDGSHVVVLGDPGAGKTTMLRRLAAQIVHEAPEEDDDFFNYVIIVVCREENWDDGSLYDVLGKKTGITGKLAGDLDNPQSRIRSVLDLGALILVDGLDEVPRRHRAVLEHDLVELGRHLGRSKMIVSCRSGDYVGQLDGFDEAEIQPLTREQIEEVVERVLGTDDAPAFYEEIGTPGHPAAELANRPLFLIQMVAIFQRRGTIPDRPIHLYESITRLIIEEWDARRRVRRTSQYDEFGVDDKRRFLADLAYELIRRDLLRFGEAELTAAYIGLADRYGLPKSEARKVVQELEAHTGLLVQSGERYEFSHLSLQEFLAAESLVRGTPNAHADWWSTYPEVAAVATGLAQDANSWFGQLVGQMPRDLANVRPVHAFLHRLGQERPRFTRSEKLGNDVLQTLFRARIEDPDAVAGIGHLEPLRGSVADALMSFDSVRRTANRTRLARYPHRSNTPTEALEVSTTVLETLIGRDWLRQIVQAAETSAV